ncbi:hypothetical protein MKW94_027383 [Papaver nudicaule]|uniref:Uncharacterized protein n=1 Tax=Papaver nudicaule TaxID=74823 RepID=A0AA41VSS9_PAPNU|nr:hypothetical protein [Papaver nudicaule]MCL7051460.1 hypothetical protein [Papaver nudicaule]
MASNNGFSWGFTSLASARVCSSDRHTSNEGSHAGSSINGFNQAGGNNNKYQSNDDNRQKFNGFQGVQAFNGNNGGNISA